jgi:hypothetical protein
VRHRALRAGEIDEHLRAAQARLDVARDRHPAGLPGKGGRVTPDGRAAGHVQRPGQHHVVSGQHGFHEHPPHAAAGAGDRHAQSTVRRPGGHGRSSGG